MSQLSLVRNVKIPLTLDRSSKVTYSIVNDVETRDKRKFDTKGQKAFTLVGMAGRNTDHFVRDAQQILERPTPFVFLPPEDIIYDLADADRFPTWELFRGELMVTDGRQGVLGTCWAMASYAALGRRAPAFVRAMFELLIDGSYSVTLYLDGRKKKVIVTAKLPCIAGKLVFASSNRRQFHIPLFEKCLAAILDTFQSVVGGFSFELFSMATGFPSYYVDIDDDDLDADELWGKLREFQNSEFPMVAESKEDGEVFGNLRGNHSYLVIAVVDLVGGHKLVQLQDPWGTSEWSGPWSYGDLDPSRWTPPMRKALYPPADPSAVDPYKGVFFMSREDLIRQFHKICFCKLRYASTGWSEYRFCGNFLRSGVDFLNLNAFKISVPNDGTELEITLHQKCNRRKSNFKEFYQTIGFVIVKLSNEGNRANVVSDVACFSGMDYDVFNYDETKLDKGTYLLLPLGYSHWSKPQANFALTDHPNRPFTLSIFSSKKLVVTPKTCDRMDFLGDLMLELAYATTPTNLDSLPGVACYCAKNGLSGGFLAVENRNNFPVMINVKTDGSINIQSTRGDTVSADVIPARSRQLLHIFTPYNSRLKGKDVPKVVHQISGTRHNGPVTNEPAFGHTASIHSPRPLSA